MIQRIRRLQWLVMAFAVSGVCHNALAQLKPNTTQIAPPTDRPHQLLEQEALLNKRIAQWQRALSLIAKHENAAMFMDVPLTDVPPNVSYDKPAGANAMTALANATRRIWKQESGVQTFARENPHRGTAQVNAALAWFTTLPESEFRRILDGSMFLSETDPDTSDLLKQLGGWEPDMNFVLVDKSDSTQVRLALSPKLRFTDPMTGVTREIQVPYRPERNLHVPAPAKHPTAQKNLDPPCTGALDFGDGVIITLADLTKRAGTVFKVRYSVDARISDNRYFLSGSFDIKSFTLALDRVSTVPAVTIYKDGRADRRSDIALLKSRIKEAGAGMIDVTRLRDQLRLNSSAAIEVVNQQFGVSEQLNAADFIQGSTMRASDLSQGRPGLSAFLLGQGVSPSTMVTLDADFMLAIQSDGTHLMSGGTSSIDGETVTSSSPNETLVGLE